MTAAALALLGLSAPVGTADGGDVLLSGDLLLIEARTLERGGEGLLNLLPSAAVLASADVFAACAFEVAGPEDVLVYDVGSGACRTIPVAERPASLDLHEPALVQGDLGEVESVEGCLLAHHAALVDGGSGFATCFAWFDCDELALVISGPAQACEGETVTLDAGPGYAEYSWEPGGETTQEIIVAPWEDTEYVVEVTDEWGCTGTASHLLVALPLPEPEITGPTAMCSGEMVTLDGGAGWAAYDWSTGEVTRTIDVSPAVTTAYTVAVVDANGCRSTSLGHLLTVDEVWQVELASRTVSLDETVRSCGMIDVGPDVVVVAPAHLVLQAGQTVVLRNGLGVEPGASLTVRLQAALNDE